MKERSCTEHRTADSQKAVRERRELGSTVGDQDYVHNDIAALYRDHAPALVASLRNTFGSGPPDPAEVAHQAFHKLIERKDCSDILNLKAFLWRTARNTFLKAIKKRHVRSHYDFEVEQIFFPTRGDNSTPEKVLEVEQELREINKVLRIMPEKRRHAFLLHKVEGLSVSAVARRLGISRTPAQKHITRAAHQIDLHLAAINRQKKV